VKFLRFFAARYTWATNNKTLFNFFWPSSQSAVLYISFLIEKIIYIIFSIFQQCTRNAGPGKSICVRFSVCGVVGNFVQFEIEPQQPRTLCWLENGICAQNRHKTRKTHGKKLFSKLHRWMLIIKISNKSFERNRNVFENLTNKQTEIK
jgi:hypothetical protein